MNFTFLEKKAWLNLRHEKYREQVSRKLSSYATEDEMSQLKQALTDRWRDIGKDHGGEELRYRRQNIRCALTRIKKGEFPSSTPETEDLLKPFRQRYELARENALPPTADDQAAWEKEIRRREELQARFGSVAA